MLSWIAVQAERVRIEQDLTEAAKAALLQSGSSWARATFQGRDASLSGKAWDEEDADRAFELLRSLPGVRIVDGKAALIEKADTYAWVASRRNQRIRLSGYAPNLASRQAILGVTKANFPGYEVVDRMTLMRGVPSADTWLGGVSFALKQLSAMRHGEVRLDDLSLTITGEAEDPAALRTIKSAVVNNPPKGIKISFDQLTAPVISPYAWTVQFAGGTFELSGYFPDEAAHAELVAAAKAGSRGAEVVDRMQPGEGAPQGWAGAAQATVRVLSKLESGSAEMKDAALMVTGVSADDAAAEAARSMLRAELPPSIKLTEQIKAREPRKAPVETAPRTVEPDPPLAKLDAPMQPDPRIDIPGRPTSADQQARLDTNARVEASVCQATLVELTKAGQILFERARAELDAASSTTLAKLTEAVKSCPDVIIRIEGHTDLEGSADSNQALALRRAQSVVDYLVGAGVDARQLEPVGFGEKRQIAPNDTSENRAKNRRIEFVVRPR